MPCARESSITRSHWQVFFKHTGSARRATLQCGYYRFATESWFPIGDSTARKWSRRPLTLSAHSSLGENVPTWTEKRAFPFTRLSHAPFSTGRGFGAPVFAPLRLARDALPRWGLDAVANGRVDGNRIYDSIGCVAVGVVPRRVFARVGLRCADGADARHVVGRRRGLCVNDIRHHVPGESVAVRPRCDELE